MKGATGFDDFWVDILIATAYNVRVIKLLAQLCDIRTYAVTVAVH